MTTDTLTLTDFLLARIAEDEERKGWWERIDSRAGLRDYRALHARKRREAECEAKRRIVELHESCDDVSFGDQSTCPELCALASVYADHPDYRSEWA